MSKRIFLKDGSSIKVHDLDRLVFEEGWVHIKAPHSRDGYYIEKSIPASNVKIIEEE